MAKRKKKKTLREKIQKNLINLNLFMKKKKMSWKLLMNFWKMKMTKKNAIVLR